MDKDLIKIKENVVNRVSVLTVILLAPVYVASLLRWITIGWQNIYIIHTLLYVFAIYLALYRKRIKYRSKIVAISIIYFIVAIIGLYNFALSGSHYYIILTLAILAILERKKSVLIITTGVFIVFFLIAVAYLKGYIHPTTDLNELTQNSLHWVASLLGIFSFTFIFIYGFGEFYHKLSFAFEQKYSSDLKHKILFDTANDAITLLKDGKFFDCNPKACELFKLERDQLIGKSVQEVSPEFQYDGQRSDEKAFNYVKLTLEGTPQQFEWQHIKSNQEIFDVSISLNKIELSNEVYVQGILRDITERKKKDYELEQHRTNLEHLVTEKTEDLKKANNELLTFNKELSDKNEIIINQNAELKATLQHLKETQSQLLHAEKMASIGILTAGVAHEINNPLNYILGGTTGIENLLKRGVGIDEKAKMFLDSIKDGVSRASGIVSGLNQLSRDSESYNEVCNLHDIIDNTLSILNNQLKHKIDINKDYEPIELITLGNVGKLHQVFLNILTNSIDAIEGKGEITIATRAQKEKIYISIIDSGHGISKENINKITEPFFTTKDPGKGTGLGLSITFNIIKDHNGLIQFHSEPNKGTKVEIILPLKKTSHE